MRREGCSCGGPELKLYDAMTSPDRQLLKAGYFVAEGALVVQQLLRMPEYRMVSMLSTEAQAPAVVGVAKGECAERVEDGRKWRVVIHSSCRWHHCLRRVGTCLRCNRAR